MPITAAAFNKILQRISKNDPTLTDLDLDDNRLGDEEAIALANALKTNNFLEGLDLGNNKISNAGTSALADALKTNKSLTFLNIWNNKIGDVGALSLANALKINSSLKTLDLGFNKIAKIGVKALADMLEDNISLINLQVRDQPIGNKIEMDSIRKIYAGTARNHTPNTTIEDKILEKFDSPDLEISFSRAEMKLASNPKISLEVFKNLYEEMGLPIKEFCNQLSSSSLGLRVLVSTAMASDELKSSLPEGATAELNQINLKHLFQTHGVSKDLEIGISPITRLGDDPLLEIFKFLNPGDIRHNKPASAAAAVDENPSTSPKTRSSGAAQVGQKRGRDSAFK